MMQALVSGLHERKRSFRMPVMALSMRASITALLCVPVVQMVPPRSRMVLTTGMVASRFQRALAKLTLGDIRVLFGVESIGPPTVVSLPMSFESP